MSRIRRLVALSVLALATISSTSTTSLAEPSSGAIAGAQSLVGEGRKLRAAGDLRGARDRFQSAYLLVPTPIIGLDLGRAHEALGELIEARAILLESAVLPPIPKESAESTGARAESLRIAKELEARIPTLVVAITGTVSGLKVVVIVDGDELPDAELTTPRKVDPGKHVVVARMGDRQERVELTVAEGQAATASIAFPEVDVIPPPPKVGGTTPKPPIVDAPPEIVTRTSPLTYIGFSIAGAGLVLGTVTGVVALKKAHDFAAACEGYNFQCPPSLQDDYDASRRYGNVSTISFLVGGAGLALGVYGLLNRQTVASTSAAAAPLAVSLGVGSLGVRGAF